MHPVIAEYRDMLPRPRLGCQEHGLRPIGIHFPIIFHSSVDLVGNFAGLPVCTMPSAIVHCNRNEAGHQKIKAPSMPC